MPLSFLYSPLPSSKAPQSRSIPSFYLEASGLCPTPRRTSWYPITCNNRCHSISIQCEMRDDSFYIRRCMELARKAIGCTNPNPMAGCVIVKDGEIVGEGFHPKARQPHAELLALLVAAAATLLSRRIGRQKVSMEEAFFGTVKVFALKDAGDLAENAAAYVSIEPCNHYGRTPPCTEALIRAKVKKVVIGMVDPNPIVASKGVERLRSSGIDVVTGVEEMLCR